MKYFSSIIIIAVSIVLATGVFIYAASTFRSSPHTDDPTVQSILEKNGWRISQIWTVYDGDLSYASATRRTFALRNNTPVQPVVTEYRILDYEAFVKALDQAARQPSTVGSRQGYVYPITGEVPSSAFVIIGATEAVTIEYGLRGFGNLIDWAQNPIPNELVPLVEQVPVH